MPRSHASSKTAACRDGGTVDVQYFFVSSRMKYSLSVGSPKDIVRRSTDFSFWMVLVLLSFTFVDVDFGC